MIYEVCVFLPARLGDGFAPENSFIFEYMYYSFKVASGPYHENVNTYKVKCGGSLEMWEESGWIHKQDPYGWFQWYCRYVG